MEGYTGYSSTDIPRKSKVFFKGFRSVQSDILQVESFSSIDQTEEKTK